MPLFQSTAGQPPLALTKDKDRIVAYVLTTAAAKRLREKGVRHGRKFPAQLLASLIRSGDAHSPRPADAAGQQTLFADDDTADLLPRCEMSGSSADLHLVVYPEGSGLQAKLLAPEARFVLQKVSVLSVPIAALSLASLGLLEATGKLPLDTAAAKTLRQWFRKDLESGWQRLAAELGRKQQTLDLGPAGGELDL